MFVKIEVRCVAGMFPKIGQALVDRQTADLVGESSIHVSQNTYSQYEIGVSRYPLDAIIKLAEYYGVSIDYLVGLTDEPKPYPRKKK